MPHMRNEDVQNREELELTLREPELDKRLDIRLVAEYLFMRNGASP